MEVAIIGGIVSIAVAVIGGAFNIVLKRMDKTNTVQQEILTQKIEFSEKLDDVMEKVDDIVLIGTSNKHAVEKIQSHIELQDKAHLSIIRVRLDKDLEFAINQGYTTKKDYEILNALYVTYKELNGNGVIDKLWENYKKLEFK